MCQRLRKAGTWPVSASVLPEQSGGEGNSLSRLWFLIFAAGLDFPFANFVLSNFADLSFADLSIAGIGPWSTSLPSLVAPLAFPLTGFAVFAPVLASASTTLPSMILTAGMVC